jgi:hypothetical protein
MDLDLLDETYPMGKSKLCFKDSAQGGLTGLAQTCNFWCQHLLIGLKMVAQKFLPKVSL